MLINTFLHCPGIGPKKERALWAAGVHTWDDFEWAFPEQPLLFRSEQRETPHTVLAESRKALANRDTDYFAERLPHREHYRIVLTLPEEAAFIDIETTGLSHYYDEITTVGASIGDEYFCYVKGGDRRKLKRFLSRAKSIITFNGKIFDLRFIAQEFPDLKLPKAHVDLRFVARSVGLRGGQKAVEQILEVERSSEIQSMVGEKAPLLWHYYRLGDIQSAKMLIKYNHADIEGMKFIFDAVVDRFAEREDQFAPVDSRHRFSEHTSKLTWASSRKTVAKNRIYVSKFRGKRGPAITYQGLTAGSAAQNLRIVGIDLTGSPKRPTGWCLIDGQHACTQQLSTDEELIVATERAQPKLVSIDSPLSLPRGRKSVRDDDPGRDEFGIMRGCERDLKRRGVNVYPSLIPSMQGLTARGIRLAEHFRSLGLPVIESYPGAAQDIMGIPRKRAGLDYLKQGLKDFGITGEFLDSKVSHDEVDAVTAAVVGAFFWSGKFEALGNDEEDYLIIPDLEKSPEPWRRRRVIGISGPIAAGKTTGGHHLKEKGFAYGRYSMVLEALLRERGKQTTRKNLQVFGEKIHHDPGQRWLCKQLVERLPEDQNLVIDGLRYPEDHAFLTETFGPGFRHVHVKASNKIRKTRFIADGYTEADFEAASAHAVEQKIGILEGLAHCCVLNERTVPGFKGRLTRGVRNKQEN